MQGHISPEAVLLVHDFTRCVRPNGTAYGTGGTCRKGTEEEKQEVHEGKSTGEKKKRGPKPGSMRITAKIKALSAEELKKVINDPRINDQQKAALQKLLAERESGKAGDTAPRKEKKTKVAEEATPQTPKTPKVTVEKIKKAFDKVSKEAVKADETVSKMYREGVEYDDPKRKAAERKKSLTCGQGEHTSYGIPRHR